MGIPASAAPFLLGQPEEQYLVQRSARFNSGDSGFFSRTPGSAGNRKTFTFAAWIKRSTLSASGYKHIFSAGSSLTESGYFGISFWEDKLDVTSGAADLRKTTAVFRDVSAWYHIVVAVDTTQATAANRVKVYVNGVEITAFQVNANPSQNADLAINSTIAHNLGRNTYNSADYFDGYITETHFIDGQALAPASFGQFDSNGEWQPRLYTGTYGTNGFRLNFSDDSAATATTLGKDSSTNSNNWTPNNIQGTVGRTLLSSATGALPVLNTTDLYGRTLGTGVRSDSFASSLEISLPLTTTGGRSLADDVIPTGRTSAAKTVSINNMSASTSEFLFYGSAARHSSTSPSYVGLPSQIINFGTSFTIECWVNRGSAGLSLWTDGNGPSGGGLLWLAFGILDDGRLWLYSYPSSTNNVSVATVPANQWCHVAFVKNGSTMTYFINGIQDSYTHTWVSPGGSVGQFQGPYVNRNDAYCQDYRIYVGVAKYTSNFIPPKPIVPPAEAANGDSFVDSPVSFGNDTGAGAEVRGNYCCLNSLNVGANITLSNGNLNGSQSSGSGTNTSVLGTMGVRSGKWYWEVTVNSRSGGTDTAIGIANSAYTPSTAPTTTANSWAYLGSALRGNNGSFVSYGATYGVGDVIGVALDLDAGTLTFYKNGVSQGQAYSGLALDTYFPLTGKNEGACTWTWSVNFGQRAFAYTAPSGFKALCDTNLPIPQVAKPSTVFDTTLYTGNGSTQNITGLGFSPDFVWIKARSQPYSNTVFDAIRGTTNYLYTDTTGAEATNAQFLTAFNSDGFSLGTNAAVNQSSTTYVAWTWDAGSSNSTNTQGSITSTVRANASAGFSIVTYTGTGTSGTIGHGGLVNLASGMIIIQTRTGTNNKDKPVYHVSTGTNYATVLNSTVAGFTSSAFWNNTAPTSSVFSVGTDENTNRNGSTYVAYCFAPVAGYSSFGSYTGNGSTDGPFVFCNFRPRWVMIKASSFNDGNTNWIIRDTSRSPSNAAEAALFPNLSNGEIASYAIDLLSNGFKLRSTQSEHNASNQTYIYAAFAESPFAYSRAR